jgi:hypothetical protein
MVREEARRTLLREYDKWAKDHPDDATKRGGVVFHVFAKGKNGPSGFPCCWRRQVGNRPRLALLHRSGEGLGGVHSIALHAICGKWRSSGNEYDVAISVATNANFPLMLLYSLH